MARAQALQSAATPFTNVRPLAQLGLLAPFEGLYRRSGYDALDALRAAVAAAPPARAAIIPLALDTSLDATRAAAKLAITPAVGAVVGPLSPHEGALAAPVLTGRTWLAPYAVTTQGFVPPQAWDWLDALVEATAQAAQAQGAARLLLGGLPPAWPAPEGSERLPAINITQLQAARPGDALLWLGSAADGAPAVAALRAAQPAALVWLAPWAADVVFFEHWAALPHSGAASAATAPEGIATILWVGPHYAAWAAAHAHFMPATYLVYEASVQAAAAAGRTPAAAPWAWRSVAIGPAGVE